MSLTQSTAMKGTYVVQFLVFLLVQISMAWFAMAGPSIATDQTALLVLKSHFIHDPTYILANWSEAAPVCSWIGVTCGVRHHRVTALNLSNLSLTGIIPSQVGNLSFLAVLSIRNNNFYGSLPNELACLLRLKYLDIGLNVFTGSIPAYLEFLPKLERLLVDANHFTGSIPRSIGNWSLIKEINFAGNGLTGEIPPEIGNLDNLEIFRVHDNALVGNIPSALFNISTLKSVHMHGNNISGSLPSNMGLFLPNLRDLRLGGNKLKGSIPLSISNASMLTFMDLSYNLLTGFIHPEVLGNLRYLQLLNLANNNLIMEPFTPEASFLSSLSSCKHLRRIDLSDNWLNTTLLISIGNLSTSLEYFWARNCKIKGSIPRETGNLTSLIALMLGNNELTGTIPSTIGRMKKLQGLDLQGNKLQGTITYDICQLEALFELFLDGNMLFGSIPECLGNLTTLGHLDLSSNNLSSTIPLTLWSLWQVLTFNISSNFISGSLPCDMPLLGVVEEFDLSRNQLSGLLPSDICLMTSLTHLSLATNELKGYIPECLRILVSLQLLDLSCNNLSGGLPNLSGLIYLQYFNVSFNGLEGEIPNEYPFLKFSADSYMMNKALCGPPMPPCRIQISLKTHQRFPKIIIIITTLAFIGIVVLVIRLWVTYKRKMSIRRRTPTYKRKMSFRRRSSAIELLNTPAVERFSYLELKQATDGFSGGNLLGIGSFGSVYKGTLRDGKVVAVKVFNVEEERSLRSFGVECEVMHNISHRNVIRIRCSSSSTNLKAIVMEYMVNGSLEKWLHIHNYHLDILQRLDIMIDIASAVKYLHHDCTTTIIHCDLKPGNVLLDEDMIAHISDFGIAKLIDHDQQQRPTTQSNLMCTIGYVAPEYGLHGILSTKADVYSFGIMLMETFTGKKPTNEMFAGEMSLSRWVINSVPHEVKRVVDPSLLQAEEEHLVARMACLSGIMRLAQCCTAESPAERFDMKEVVNILNKIKELLVKNLILGN